MKRSPLRHGRLLPYASMAEDRLKVELRPAAPIEVMVSREEARAFKEWMDGGA